MPIMPPPTAPPPSSAAEKGDVGGGLDATAAEAEADDADMPLPCDDPLPPGDGASPPTVQAAQQARRTAAEGTQRDSVKVRRLGREGGPTNLHEVSGRAKQGMMEEEGGGWNAPAKAALAIPPSFGSCSPGFRGMIRVTIIIINSFIGKRPAGVLTCTISRTYSQKELTGETRQYGQGRRQEGCKGQEAGEGGAEGRRCCEEGEE